MTTKAKILQLQRQFGCLKANVNRLARELYNLQSAQHAASLQGKRDRASGVILPCQKPTTERIVRGMANKTSPKSDDPGKHDFLRKFDWTPFKPLPCIRDMHIEKGEMNKIYEYFGVNKRYDPKITFRQFSSKHHIRYAAMMIARQRTLSDKDRYWRQAKFLMSRSTVFTVMAINHVFPRWHRELPLHLIIKWMYKVQELARLSSSKLDFKRVYIPKPNGKLRPLGVPTEIWRLYLAQLHWFYQLILNPLIPDWQHAYQPQKGTGTAWREILSKVIGKRYIYEFDLQNFFGSVQPSRVINWLIQQGVMNRETYRQLYAISGRVPKFADGPISEADLDAYYGTRDAQGNPRDFNPVKTTGFPQGANLSPLLSILLLAQTSKPKFADILMYADDGIFYSDNEFSEEDVCEFFETLGLSLSREKSAWVKKSVWLKPLKFLGLEYKEGSLFANTRRGVIKQFDKLELAQALLNAGGSTERQLSANLPVVYHKEHGQLIPQWKTIGEYHGGSWSLLKTKALATEITIRQTIFGNHKIIRGPEIWVDHETVVKNYTSDKRRRVLTWVREFEAHKYMDYKEYVVWSESSSIQYGFNSKLQASKYAVMQQSESGAYWQVARFHPDGSCLVSNINRVASYEAIAESNFMGFVMSRLYTGSWNEEVFQNFSLKGVSKSWLHALKRNAKRSLNFANSTSFAAHDIIGLYRISKRKALYQREYEAGNLTWPQWMKLREALGLQPLGWRKLKLQKPVKKFPNAIPLKGNSSMVAYERVIEMGRHTMKSTAYYSVVDLTEEIQERISKWLDSPNPMESPPSVVRKKPAGWDDIPEGWDRERDMPV